MTVLLAFALAQEAGERVRAAVAKIASIDPAERSAAAAELAKFPREDVRKGTPEGFLAAGFLGDTSARGEVARLLANPRYAAAAAEVLAKIGPDAHVRDLIKVAESDDPEAAFAAARALAKSRSPAAEAALRTMTDKPERRRSVVGAYGCELRKRERLFKNYLLGRATNEDLLVSEFAIVAIANLPSAAEDAKLDYDEKTQQKGGELRKVFLEKPHREVVRRILGDFLLRSGLFAYGDVAALLLHDDPAVRDWARRRAWARRSVSLAEIVRRYTEPTADRVEPVLQELSGPVLEGEPKDRIARAKEWWEKNRAAAVDKDVVKAIDEGVAWLRARQQPDGTWKYCQCGHPGHGATDHTAGTTALVLYTLLKCDVPWEDKGFLKGLEFLLALPLDKITNAHTYTVSLMAMVFGEAVRHLKADRKTKDSRSVGRLLGRLKECADWLVEAQLRLRKGGYDLGPWTYNKPPAGQYSDNSNTQFAMMGLLAAQNAGIPLPAGVWQRSLGWWMQTQCEDGGWPYVFQEENRKVGTDSMSAAGVYCFLISNASIKKKDPKSFAGEEPIRKSFARWKGRYPVPDLHRSTHPGHVFSPYYDLYSLERAMMISGTTRLDGRDWYRDGALFILYNHQGAGEWLDVTDTCFALLFLKKAYIPVASGEDK